MASEHNRSLSRIFSEMSAIYKYLGAKERFRAAAYSKAAKVIGSLQEDISVYAENKSLEEISGIGEGISEKIIEFIKTGKIKKHEQLKAKVPFELIEMLEVKGFGPQSLHQIHNTLNISTKADLIRALQDGRISKIKGFGQKKKENMLRGLKLHKTMENRMLLWNALIEGQKMVNWLKKTTGVKQVDLAGSIRRRKETIGDIDILVASAVKDRPKIISHFTSPKFVKRVLVKGNTKASIILKDSDIQIDLRIVNEDEWGSALQYFTGSKEHNIHLRTIAKEKGYKISEYGIFSITTGKKLGGRTEEEIYRTLGFPIMPPEMRENKGEIELAAKGRIPKIVSLKDIKGDLHLHSGWSDGINTLEEVSKYILKTFSYNYIAITDHSKTSRIANGMSDQKILQQIKAIKELNQKLGVNFVKAGIEVDILPDGTLDVSDEILAQLDWITASIHSNFNRDNTDRIIRACENQYVNCIGHPTGRLIGAREQYKLDLNAVIESAFDTNTALEINAQPQRMDLNDDLSMMARKRGVKLVIGSDSHSLNDLNFMVLGVSIARRAWCKPSDILNTYSWSEIENWKSLKR